jgi:hypothetical protein
MNAADVTACLVTRGDQPDMMRRIHDSLIFTTGRLGQQRPPRQEDRGPLLRRQVGFHRRRLLPGRRRDRPAETQQALLDAYEPGVMVANWAHGDDPDGYDDLPLVGAGAIADRDLVLEAEQRYLARFPNDDDYLYDCDFAVGVLYPKR